MPVCNDQKQGQCKAVQLLPAERGPMVRVWDIHPGYLSRQNLLGQHAEIHALYSVITGRKKGYAAHPETVRWSENPGLLKRAHALSVLEMQLRGFNHASPCGDDSLFFPQNMAGNGPDFIDDPVEQIKILDRKNRDNARAGRIPLPKNGFEFWAHHKYSVMARGYNHYREVQAYLRPLERCPLEEAGELIDRVHAVMAKPVTCPALSNVVDHLWGYFKREASGKEKESCLNRNPEELPALVRYLYSLALKYNRIYLLHSTIFADFLEPH